MTLSAGQVSLGVIPQTNGFGAKLHEGIMAESGGLFGLGKELGGHLMEGLGAIGVAVGVGEFVKKGVEEYASADALNAQFKAGIESTGNAANLSVKDMDELAKSISGYSGQSYESIGKTEQVLQTFTNLKNVGPDKIFDDATTAAANMAAKLGGDASASAVQLGKALNDPVKGVTALQRVGVSFTQSQKDSIAEMVKSGDTMGAQKLILSELNTEFGGAAKAAGETLPGEIARSKVAFGELTKAVMGGVMPFLTPMIGTVADTLNKATPHIEHFGEVFKENVHKAAESLAPAKEAVAVFFDGIKTGTNDVGDGGLLDVVGKLGNSINKAFTTGKTAAQVFFDGVKTGGNDIGGGGLLDKIGKMGDFVHTTFVNAKAAAQVFFDGLKTGSNDVGGGGFLAAVGGIGNALHDVFAQVGPLIPQILGLASAFSPLHLIFTAIAPVIPQIIELVAQIAASLSRDLAGALVSIMPSAISFSKMLSDGLVSAVNMVLPLVMGFFHFLADNQWIIWAVVGAWAAFNAVQVVMQGITLATSAAASVATAAQWLWNAAMDANPMMLIVIGIGALVAAIIWVATKTTFFQDAWKVCTEAIGNAWNWLWNSVISPVVGFFVGAFNNISKAIQSFWTAYVQPVINSIGAIFTWLWKSIIWPIIELWLLAFTLVGLGAKWLWDNAIKPAVDAIVAGFQFLGSVVSWLWNNAIQPAIKAVGDVFNWLWANVIMPIVDFIVGYFQMLGSIASWLWTNAISPAINAIGDVFNWLWNSVISPIGQWIGGAFQAIGDTAGRIFGAIGSTIRGAFDGVVGFIKGVINSVIDVINGGIGSINTLIDAVNSVPGAPHFDHLGTIPHLATGGTIRTPGVALVGENGPEVVSLPAGATVYPTGTGPKEKGGHTFNIFEAVNATATAQTVMTTLTARRV